jgi:hypothetical protein
VPPRFILERPRFVPEPPVYSFRVRLRGGVDPEDNPYEEVSRVIEVAANQTLEDLGEAIHWLSTSTTRTSDPSSSAARPGTGPASTRS